MVKQVCFQLPIEYTPQKIAKLRSRNFLNFFAKSHPYRKFTTVPQIYVLTANFRKKSAKKCAIAAKKAHYIIKLSVKAKGNESIRFTATVSTIEIDSNFLAEALCTLLRSCSRRCRMQINHVSYSHKK